jgi:calpain-7
MNASGIPVGAGIVSWYVPSCETHGSDERYLDLASSFACTNSFDHCTLAKTGAYTNNPQVLVRYDVSDPSDANLSLVLSQYKKSNDLAYTLSCFCTEQFSLGLPERDLEHSVELSASWTTATAGGPIGSKNFISNPMFAVNVPDGGAVVQLRVSTKTTAAVNVVLVPVDSFRQRADRAKGQPIIDSDIYKHGFVVSEKVKVKSGPYVVVVSNFHAGQTAPFVLRVCSSQKVNVEALG